MNNKKHFRYFIQHDLPLYNEIKHKIHSTLNDSRGWIKYGYTFEEVSQYNPDIINSDIIYVTMMSSSDITQKFGSKGLSLYIPRLNKIIFNYENWSGLSKSSLPKDRYQTYVINHEFGHALGYDHPNTQTCIDGDIASVMVQMTKGPDFVAPCIENEWPLDPIKNNPNKKYDELKNPRYISYSVYNFIFILTLIIIIYILILKSNIFIHKKSNSY